MKKSVSLPLLIEEELPDMPYGDDDKGKGGKFDPAMPEQHLILYDYKTQNSRAFSYKRPNMSHYHKMQLGTYMYMLRNMGGQNTLGLRNWGLVKQLKESRILKISKDDLRMNEEQLLWSPELESEVISYWTKLNEHWKNKTLPACSCADYEGGFMAKEQWNGYYYAGEPCSAVWYKKWKKDNGTL